LANIQSYDDQFVYKAFKIIYLSCTGVAVKINEF